MQIFEFLQSIGMVHVTDLPVMAMGVDMGTIKPSEDDYGHWSIGEDGTFFLVTTDGKAWVGNIHHLGRLLRERMMEQACPSSWKDFQLHDKRVGISASGVSTRRKDPNAIMPCPTKQAIRLSSLFG